MNAMSVLIRSVDQAGSLRSRQWLPGGGRGVWPGDREFSAVQEAIADGKPVFSLTHLFHMVGARADSGLPVLAICRADYEVCLWGARVDVDRFAFLRASESVKRAHSMHRVDVARFTQAEDRQAYARAPFVPPAARKDLSPEQCYVIWDAQWVTADRPPMSRDPALVTRLHGDLYALESTWDLSPAEVRLFEAAMQ